MTVKELKRLLAHCDDGDEIVMWNADTSGRYQTRHLTLSRQHQGRLVLAAEDWRARTIRADAT